MNNSIIFINVNKPISILQEIENNFIDFGYHYTTVDKLESIKENGLKINQQPHHSISGTHWIHTAYGMSPIFMGIRPQKQYGPRFPLGSTPIDWVLLKVNVTGLDIAADLGTLINYGAYIEENGFWFKRKPAWLNDNNFTYDELQGSDAFDLKKVIKNTQTFVVLQDIPSDRIKVVSYKGQTIDKIKNMLDMPKSQPVQYRDFYKDLSSDAEHGEQLAKTGFWGKQGAGCIFLAKDTKRILLPFRSRAVLEPNTWGVWGGAIDKNESPESAVRREVKEEAGYKGNVEFVKLAVFQKDSFQYHNFLAIVDTEFTPDLNWETETYKWVPYGEWPSPMHFGLKYLIDNSGNKIENIIKSL